MIKIKRCKIKIKRKTENNHKRNTRLNLDYLFPGNAARKRGLFMVYICVKVKVDLQADKSPIVVKGPFFPRVVNPRYRICGTMCNARSNLIRRKHFDLKKGFCIYAMEEP
jgi:hypothetical protein